MDGEIADGMLGNSVSGGDFNGDGHADLLLAAHKASNPEYSAGRAYICYGSSDGLNWFPDWEVREHALEACYGWSVSSAGDINGDGYDDVLIGADRHPQNGMVSAGQGYLYLGSASGPSTTPIWINAGDEVGGYLGYCVSAAGDVNGDGLDDYMVGAPYQDGVGGDAGEVFLRWGTRDAFAIGPDWSMMGSSAGGWAGYCVRSAGDLNADGYSDIIISAPLTSTGYSWSGRVLVYLGSSTGPGADADWLVDGTQAWGALGESVSTAGDVNGDGFDDFLIGTGYYDDGSASNVGIVYAYYGSPDWPGARASADAPAAGAGLPELLTSLGPSPFREGCLLRVGGLEHAGTVRLSVHDVRGRRLRELYDGASPRDGLTIFWDGRDDGGAVTPPGVYFLRLQGSEIRESLRLVRVR